MKSQNSTYLNSTFNIAQFQVAAENIIRCKSCWFH